MKIEDLKNRYKIIKFEDGLGEESYIIKRRKWMFWFKVTEMNHGFDSCRVVEFHHIDRAEEWIASDIQRQLSWKKRKVEETIIGEGLSGHDIVDAIKKATIKRKLKQ